MAWILETSSSYSFVFLRLGLAVTFFLHSTTQIFGWHGGRGLKAHLANWRDRQEYQPIGALGLFIEFFSTSPFSSDFYAAIRIGIGPFIIIAMLKSCAARLFPGAPPG
jgi:hypothetical protein